MGLIGSSLFQLGLGLGEQDHEVHSSPPPRPLTANCCVTVG